MDLRNQLISFQEDLDYIINRCNVLKEKVTFALNDWRNKPVRVEDDHVIIEGIRIPKSALYLAIPAITAQLKVSPHRHVDTVKGLHNTMQPKSLKKAIYIYDSLRHAIIQNEDLNTQFGL